LIDLDGGNSILKLTVASYYRPSGENIHRFKNAKTTDKWGVSPDPGMEVKLTHREFVTWFIARRERDRDALAKGHRKTTEPQPSGEVTKTDAKPKKPAEKAEDQKTREKTGAKPKSAQASPGPYVDTQLDRALEIIRTRLAAVKAKNAI
jgi:carboxyl-terminal processing protease